MCSSDLYRIPQLGGTKSVFTIHNIEYQGRYGDQVLQDIIHCNDWQTALVPVYLLEEKYRIPQLGGTKSVFTIHNIEYQGRYGDQVLQDVIGLDKSYLNEGMLAYHRDVNLMKGAIMASNFVTTVSPTYAQELRTPFYAHGLDGVINQQSGKLEGILNGIDEIGRAHV